MELKAALHDTGQWEATGALITGIAKEIRADFINIDRYMDINTNHLQWLLTDTAEKNPYTSDLFYNCCTLIAFSEVILKDEGNRVVFCEDEGLIKQMENIAAQKGKRLTIPDTKRQSGNPDAMLTKLLRMGKDHLEASAIRFLCLLSWVREYRLVKRALPLKRIAAKRTSEAPDVILMVWATPTTFKSGGKLANHSFYGPLPMLLNDAGLNVWYLAAPVSWVFGIADILENIRRSKDVVLVPTALANPRQCIAFLLKTWLNGIRIKRPIVLSKTDITDLVRSELEKEKKKVSPLRAFLFFSFCEFLRKQDIQAKTLIFPYEGQPWEKGLEFGLKRYSCRIKTAGYQHTPISDFWMGCFPSRLDREAGIYPDTIITIGNAWKKKFSDSGIPAERLRVGPALRFIHLCESKPDEEIDARPDPTNANAVLVAPSISYDEAFELLHKTVAALWAETDLRVYIKFHPSMAGSGKKLIEDMLRISSADRLPDHFRVTREETARLIKRVQVLICDYTSVADEALMAGVPVIELPSDIWFHMDKAGSYPGIIKTVTHAGALADTVRELMAETEERRAARVARTTPMLGDMFNFDMTDAAKLFALTR